MDRDKLIKQLFIGKIAGIIGVEETTKLLKDATESIDSVLKSRKADVSGEFICRSCGKDKNEFPNDICEDCTLKSFDSK